MKLIRPEVLAEHREAAHVMALEGRTADWAAAGVIVAIWVILSLIALHYIIHRLR